MSEESYTALLYIHQSVHNNKLIHRLSDHLSKQGLDRQQRLRSEVMRVLPAAALQLQDLAAFQTRGVSVCFLLRDVPALLTAHAILLIPAKTKSAP